MYSFSNENVVHSFFCVSLCVDLCAIPLICADLLSFNRYAANIDGRLTDRWWQATSFLWLVIAKVNLHYISFFKKKRVNNFPFFSCTNNFTLYLFYWFRILVSANTNSRPTVILDAITNGNKFAAKKRKFK